MGAAQLNGGALLWQRAGPSPARRTCLRVPTTSLARLPPLLPKQLYTACRACTRYEKLAGVDLRMLLLLEHLVTAAAAHRMAPCYPVQPDHRARVVATELRY